RWLNITTRPLPTAVAGNPLDVKEEDAGIAVIQDSIESVRINEVGTQVLEYLSAGFSADRLLHETGNTILKDDTGNFVLPTLPTIFDEWEHPLIAKHPARNQLLIGLARYATDARRRKGSKSAALTAQRFARGQTSVDLYEGTDPALCENSAEARSRVSRRERSDLWNLPSANSHHTPPFETTRT